MTCGTPAPWSRPRSPASSIMYAPAMRSVVRSAERRGDNGDSASTTAGAAGSWRSAVVPTAPPISIANLVFPDAAERQAKLRLAYAPNQVLDARKLSPADTAKVLSVTQPKVSALRNYKLAGFSVERLMNLLTALDQDVEIVISTQTPLVKTGRISVVAA
jgi:predicted XRE-type DNA-binding protein